MLPIEPILPVEKPPKIQEKPKETNVVKRKTNKKIKTDAVKRIKTDVDKIVHLIKERPLTISEISKELLIDPKKIEEYGLDLQERGIVKVIYPANVLASPKLKLIKKIEEDKIVLTSGDVIDEYKIVSNDIPIVIRIVDIGEKVPVYELIVPIIGKATQYIMKKLMKIISEEVDITSEDLFDPQRIIKIKEKFHNKAVEKINEKFPNLSEENKKIIAGIITQNMYGLKDIEYLMADGLLEEISINSSSKPIAVYHKKYGWCMTNLRMTSEEETLTLASSIGRKVGKTISLTKPLLDAHLLSGDRVQATLFPISSNGNTITIRKFSRNPWTITQFIKNKTMSSEIGALLWLAVQYELSILISGGTASGKTSCLNTIIAMIPSNQRVISIEDVREINLPKSLAWNWVPLTSRVIDKENSITMLDLMIASLRMRPDRIIVGEVRKKKQAEVLFEAINTGHSVYATLHANNSEQTYIRLVEDPISIPKSELEGLSLIIVMFRDRRKGFRKLIEVSEIVPIPGEVGERNIKINILYRWSPKTDTWEKLSESERLINEIGMHTGMTEDEIKEDIMKKKVILDWMVKHDIMNIDDFGKIINEYYKNPERIYNLAKNDESPEEII